MSRPLLVIDGDSLAHRAYHALPKTFRRADKGPANALLGFSNFLVRLWESEQPRAVLVGWDSIDTPTYRHELLETYQSGRVFDEDLLEHVRGAGAGIQRGGHDRIGARRAGHLAPGGHAARDDQRPSRWPTGATILRRDRRTTGA